VPGIERPDIAALKSLVNMSPVFAILFDRDLNVIENSPSHKAQMQLQYGLDVVGQNWLNYMPLIFLQEIDRRGGWDQMMRQGFSSVTSDYIRQAGERGNSSEHCGRVQQTSLRLSDGEIVHLSLTTTISKAQAVLKPPQLIFLDEVMTDE
jgi:hypothetical protein